MIKHANGLSKNNYRCGYFDDDSAFNLSSKHSSDSLKIIHVNIESFSSNGTNFSSYLKSLKFQFDVICLTETRFTSIGLIDKEFPNFDIYILTTLL